MNWMASIYASIYSIYSPILRNRQRIPEFARSKGFCGLRAFCYSFADVARNAEFKQLG
jgi:hypothetical protein